MKFTLIFGLTLATGVCGAKVKFDKGNLEVQAAQTPCPVGYTNGTAGCVDVDECKSTTHAHICPFTNPCVNTKGSFYCKCQPGFSGQHPRCVNINECDKNYAKGNNCSNLKTGIQCVDTPGSYTCDCKPGWYPVAVPAGKPANCSDLDECKTGRHNCFPMSNCTNTIGSFTCKCPVGYMGDGVSCADFDECVMGNKCDAQADCTNTAGSYTCACRTGFSGNGTICKDINECNASSLNTTTILMMQQNANLASSNVSAGVNTCNQLTGMCVNTVGSYVCSCKPGYSGNGINCTNIDECSTNSHNCPKNAECTDTVGSYYCNCKAGYKWKNLAKTKQCIDIDECWINMIARGTTTTTTSTRMRGHPFRPMPVSVPPAVTLPTLSDGGDEFGLLEERAYVERSVEEEEAAQKAKTVPAICHINSTCTNNVGSFTCKCNAGWVGDGTNCADIDECKFGLHNCDNHATCNNTIGSFTCKCLPGYNGTGSRYSGTWPPTDGCWDIDECQRPLDRWNNSACVNGSSCKNTVGSYSCACSPGYTGNGLQCINMDECALNVHNCHKFAKCNETVGSFECKCMRGWVGNGISCTSEKSIEMGVFRMTNVSWKTVNFSSTFKSAPIVVVQVNLGAPRELYARVKEVSKHGFKVAISFQMGLNNTKDELYTRWINNTIQTMNYLAVIPGKHKLTADPNATIVHAGFYKPSGQMRRSTACDNQPYSYWDRVVFANYTSRPLLYSQILGVTNLTWKGGALSDFCITSNRFNSTKFVNNTNISDAQIARTCDSQHPGAYQGTELIGWIVVGQNNTLTEVENKNISVVTKLWVKNITGNKTGEESDYNGTTFASAPIVMVSKATSTQYAVGSLEFAGALKAKALFSIAEDKTCPAWRKREEYVSIFAAAERISV
eukprot:TRINITY_DN986_c0_g1_i2.p1 TRINITY_DN986_c0_g1~~TRINITY_DN986_c0_g1_i2.p1  ORF type:complete len:898 (+),score=192.51 TRINITY_DN986_c0_g1_i2:101-2794(+)